MIICWWNISSPATKQRFSVCLKAQSTADSELVRPFFGRWLAKFKVVVPPLTMVPSLPERSSAAFIPIAALRSAFFNRSEEKGEAIGLDSFATCSTWVIPPLTFLACLVSARQSISRHRVDSDVLISPINFPAGATLSFPAVSGWQDVFSVAACQPVYQAKISKSINNFHRWGYNEDMNSIIVTALSGLS